MQQESKKTIERAKPTFMGKIPQAVWAYFALHGVSKEEVLLGMSCDLSADGTYLDAYVLLTEKALFVSEGGLTFTRDTESRRRTELYDAP
ncbi:MAG: hypothetical protein IKV50_00365, partial [Clostridia bacterium]|nr:hypothetical protein [Clostridia bacterium]